MARLIVEPSFWELFPDALIGVIHATGMDNTRSGPEAAALLEGAIAQANAALGEAELGSHPAVAPWRAAYKAFGVKPSDYKSSIEGLLRSARSGRLGSVNPLVDLYNTVSLRHLLPAGGEDLAAVSGDVRLTRAAGDEPFVRLGGTENEPPPAGAVIYRDDLGVICSCWNWREADRTQLTPATRDAILVLEALPPVTAEHLRAALDELAGLVEQHLGGSATVHVVDRAHPDLATA